MRKIILLVVVLSCSAIGLKAEVNAKNSTGVEPIYSYKGGLNEAINFYNGNLNVSVPILSLKGRAGMDLNLYFSYDSRQFRVWSDVCASDNAEWNYEGQTTGRWIPSFAPQIVAEGTYESGVRWAEIQLEGGARHRFDETNLSQQRGQSTNATDMTYNFYYKDVSTKGGLWYNFSDPLRIRKVDANGNYQAFIRDSQGRTTQIQDNLGRAVNIYYEDFYQPQLPTRITVLGQAGQTLTYTFLYQTKRVDPRDWGYWCTSIVAGATAPFLTRINLPDGTFWSFNYHEGSPGGATTALLSRIDYPLGGYSRYNYENSNWGLGLKLTQKLVNANGGQGELATSYAYTQPPASQWSTRVTEPDGSYAISGFSNGNYDDASGRQISQAFFNAGGTALNQELQEWTIDASGVYRRYSVTTGISYGSTKVNYEYDAVGNVTYETHQAWTSNPPSYQMPFRHRQIARTYQTFGPSRPAYFEHTFYRLQEESVTDSAWAAGTTLVAKTRYDYDQFAVTQRGSVVGYDANLTSLGTVRGNATTISRWLASESRWVASKNYYDSLGNAVQTTDPRNYSTTINYSSTFHYAYPTQLVNAKGQSVSTNYSFYTGQPTSATNENNQTSTTSYDGLNRPSRIDGPDGSYTRLTYDLTLNNFATTMYKSVASGQEASSTTYLDGIGREKKRKTADPAGDIYVDTVYALCDCTGKTAKVSNPYRSGETVYWTETQYDAIGRPIKIIPPDGTSSVNYASYTYNLNNPTTTVTDPAGNRPTDADDHLRLHADGGPEPDADYAGRSDTNVCLRHAGSAHDRNASGKWNDQLSL